MGARLDALREMVAADPGDALALLLLGRECLAAGLLGEAVEHLRAHLSAEPPTSDRGAAYGAYADALVGLGRVAEARAALDAGIQSARAHRHLGLVADLEARRDDLPSP